MKWMDLFLPGANNKFLILKDERGVFVLNHAY